MKPFNTYQTRPIRFLGLEKHGDWTIKVYSISSKNEYAGERFIASAKANIPLWLKNVAITQLPSCHVATLIIHEGREACFAIISCWVDENMLQLFAYLASPTNPEEYQLVSDKGIVSCVWEMAVLWFERNAWVKYVLQQPDHPDALIHYLQQHLNDDV